MEDYKTNFPDKEYLKGLAAHFKSQVEERQGDRPVEQLMMYAGVTSNWITYFITDENIDWEKRTILIDELTLTGRHPEWHPIIAVDSERSPAKLRQLLERQPEIRERFRSAEFVDIPIMVYVEDGRYNIFDGMHRTIGAIMEGRHEIEAFIATARVGGYKPKCEPHVVSDLIKTLYRDMDGDESKLLSALILLKTHYPNVRQLLLEWRKVKTKAVRRVVSRALAA